MRNNFKWVVFEGVDCCGKSTVSKKVFQYFLKSGDKYDNLFVSITTEPYNTIDDVLIKSYCNDDSLDRYIDFQNYYEDLRANIKYLLDNNVISKELKLKLFLEDRKLLLKSYKIWEKVASSCLVLQDRSYISTLVYQSIYNNKTIYSLMEENREIFKQIWDIRPDVIVYLRASEDVVVDRMVKRGKMDYFDAFAEENISKLIEKYDLLLKDKKIKSVDVDFKGEVLVVDANKPVMDCASEVIKFIDRGAL